MPSAAKTTDAEIVQVARRLVESHGHDGFSMNELASAVGVRAPSLYGRFVDRAALIDHVERELWAELWRTLAAAAVGKNPIEILTAQAHAYRAFGKANPKGYALLFRPDSDRSEEGVAARAAAASAAIPALVALVGEREALLGARVLTPFLHGFVSMEISGAFQLGGGLDAAFEHGVATILKGLERADRRPPGRTSKSRPNSTRR